MEACECCGEDFIGVGYHTNTYDRVCLSCLMSIFTN
jgi:hypothetical protein